MIKGKNKKTDKVKNQRRSIIDEEGNESGSEVEEENKKSSLSKKRELVIKKKVEKKNELKLEKIVLENFKSFEGRHEVGYFLNFSVVLGPNGSGKSNIIDAICFALGMKTISLRTKNLKDLIYKKDADEEHSKRTCFVELQFTKDGKDICFRRTITIKGSSDFFFNNSKISPDDYLEKLEELQIPSKARYFILVQGAIDTILSKKNDLTETIEFLSDSYTHKEDYERVKAEIKSLNDEISKLSSEMHSIKDDRNKVKTQIENEEKYNQLISKLNQNLNKIYLFKLAEMDTVIRVNEENLEQNEESMQIIQDEKKEILDYIKSNEFDVRKFEAEFKKSENENNQCKDKVEEVTNKLSQCVENSKLYETQIFSKLSMLNQQKTDKKRKDEKKAALLSQKSSLEKEIEEVKNRIDNDGDLINKNLDKVVVEEFKSLSRTLEVETFQINKEQEKIQLQLTEIKNQRSILEKNLSKLENEKSSIEGEIKTNMDKSKAEEEIKTKLEIENISNKSMLSNKESEKAKLETDWEKAYKLLNEKLVQLTSYENESYETAKKKKITDLMNRNTNVHGFLYELITPLQKKLEIPIKVSLLKYLNYLVVENAQTAKECSEYLKSKEINADVLVLENIPEKGSDESVRLRLGNLGNLVIDLIDSKKKGLKNALNYFLKDLVLCYDKENIQKIKSKGFHSIILLDGTIYKKGTISGGSYRNLDQYSFNYKANSQEEMDKLRKEVEVLSKQVHAMEEKKNDYKELSMLRNKIIEKENLMEVCAKNIKLFSENVTRLTLLTQKKEEQIEEISTSMKRIESDQAELLSQSEEISKKKNNLKEKLFSSFMEKNNLSSLKDFESFSLSEIKRLSEELKTMEEKLHKINAQIKVLEASDELILKLESNLNEDKERKKQFEKKKEDLEKELKEAQNAREKYLSAKNEDYKKIHQIKESLKLKQAQLDQIDKRIRSLLKNKIEFEHKIVNSIESKKSIIEESKLNIDSYIKDINNINQTFSVFVSFDVNIERFIIANETKLNKTNLIIDYADIETKTKIHERTIEGHRQKMDNCKNKFSNLMKELEKYVKLCALNESEANRLKDKEEELARKKKQTSLQVDSLVNEMDKKKKEFERIKKERKEKFETFFKKLSTKLSSTYKELTTPQDSSSPGGSAYIYNTNEDEPYLGTVCYLPTPPGKRVIYDIDQLSGGEKTIAILSLVISIQNICFTPFVILDEIDSYLDPEHEAILEHLFKTQNKNFQIIIVTHKSTIFRSAESLIGTYFNKKKFSSVPISVDMTQIY